MSNMLSRNVRQDVERTMEEVADTLRRAADNLVEDAEEGVAQAAAAVKRATQALALKSGRSVKDIARKAQAEVEAHPVASATAALAAAAALIGLLAAARTKATS